MRAVYPTPEEPGTELGFEEVWARNRGWLDRTWPDDVVEEGWVTPVHDENRSSEVDLLAEAVSEKLLVQHDVVALDENGAPIMPHTSRADHDVVMLDENGAPIFPHKSKKKKKVVEVNETQISECS